MIKSIHQTTTSNNSSSLVQDHNRSERPALQLVLQLCRALSEENVRYCHWKSNDALDRSANGENDVDLLVERADIPRFSKILYRLGFKQAVASFEKQMPGVLDYFGYDKEADQLVHVHAHYQLMLGHDMTKNYRLPIESAYVASAVQQDLFMVPAPEFEFIVLVIRMILKHSTWDVMLARQGKLKASERGELTYLQDRIDRNRVDDILDQHLPYVGRALFSQCIQALQPGCSAWMRIKVGQGVQKALQANARRPQLFDIYLKMWRRLRLAVRRRVNKTSSKYRLQSGGAMIAIVGGDGAGKSTALDALNAWLSKYFALTQVHMGKPAWSWTTITLRAILKIGNLLRLYPVETSFQKTLKQKSPVSPGYPWLIREACRARDRYLVYRKARRFAANGGLTLLDRFPLPQITLMDGPQAERFLNELESGPLADQRTSPHHSHRFARRLVTREKSYYHYAVLPELLVVLRLDPEIAVQRKPEEDATFVRERNMEIWEQDWAETGVHVFDGSKPKEAVLAELKSLVWSQL